MKVQERLSVVGCGLSVVGCPLSLIPIPSSLFPHPFSLIPGCSPQLRHLSHIVNEKNDMPVIIRKSVDYGCKCFEEEEAAAMNREKQTSLYIIMYYARLQFC